MLGIRPEEPIHLRNRVVEVSAPTWRFTLRWVTCSTPQQVCFWEFWAGFLRACPAALDRFRYHRVRFGPSRGIAHVNHREVFSGVHSPFQFFGRDSRSVSREDLLSGVEQVDATPSRKNTSDPFSSRFPTGLGCIGRTNGVTTASFAPIQRFNQFLNQRSQFGGVAFICHRNTKFAPILLHAVNHVHLRYSGANACEMLR